MMKIFLTNHVVLFILVVTTTIDASRILYLPLPMRHSSHQQAPTPKAIPEVAKKPKSDEYIPASAIEQEEIEKRGDSFDWEELLDQDAEKRRTPLDDIQAVIERVKQPSELLDLNQHLLEEPWIVNTAVERAERFQSTAEINSAQRQKRRNDTLFIVIVGTCCVVGMVGLVAAATFWYKIQKRAEAAVDSDYPSYGVTGPNASGSKISPSSTMSDRKLAQSAQMYHYQQQRQQMMAQEKAHLDTKPVHSDDSDDEAPEGGDYTVYECPGLAPTGEMEVRNPLFAEHDSSLTLSPTSTHPPINSHFPQLSTSPPKEKSLP